MPFENPRKAADALYRNVKRRLDGFREKTFGLYDTPRPMEEYDAACKEAVDGARMDVYAKTGFPDADALKDAYNYVSDIMEGYADRALEAFKDLPDFTMNALDEVGDTAREAYGGDYFERMHPAYRS
jgi:hypothetical protein